MTASKSKSKATTAKPVQRKRSAIGGPSRTAQLRAAFETLAGTKPPVAKGAVLQAIRDTYSLPEGDTVYAVAVGKQEGTSVDYTGKGTSWHRPCVSYAVNTVRRDRKGTDRVNRLLGSTSRPNGRTTPLVAVKGTVYLFALASWRKAGKLS